MSRRFKGVLLTTLNKVAGKYASRRPCWLINLYNASDGLNEVASLMSALQKGNVSKGFWNEQASEGAVLTVYAACRIEAGEEIRVCFKVKNPIEPAPKSPVKVFSSDDPSNVPGLDMEVRMSTILGLPMGTSDDPHPMYIRTPRFESLETYQTSPFPGDDNQVTINFKVNVPFLNLESCKTTLTVTGLTGSITSSSKAMVLHNDTSQSFERQGAWEMGTGTLFVNVTRSTAAGEAFTIKVALRNQFTYQDAQDVILSTSGVVVSATKATTPDHMRPAKVISHMCAYVALDQRDDCGQFDSRPMKIYDPEFLIADVQQESDWPGASNKLTIELVTNAKLSGEMMANISVSTLNDESSAPAPFIVGNEDNREGAFCGVSAASAENLFVLYSHENVRARFGKTHDRNAEHFVCVKVEYTYVNRTLAWSWINVTEKPAPGPCRAWPGLSFPQGFYINATSNQTVNCSVPANATGLAQVVDVNSSQFYVNHTTWRYYTGQQWAVFNPVPTDLLVANISNGKVTAMATGVVGELDLIGNITAGFVPAYRGQQSDLIFTAGTDKNIKISGDFLTPPVVALMGSAADIFRTGPHNSSHRTWKQNSPPQVNPWVVPKEKALVGSAKITDQSDDTALIFLQMRPDKDISLGVRTVFSFYVLNPVEAQPAQVFEISAMSQGPRISKTTMKGKAIFVVAPAFVERKAGQSSPFPCTINTITVTLITNMHLRGVDHATILIKNFDGAIVGATGTVVSILDASGGSEHGELFDNSAGVWEASEYGNLKLDLSSTKNMIAGRDYRFSFEIDNPQVKSDKMRPMGAMTGAGDAGTMKQAWTAPELTIDCQSSASSLFAVAPVTIGPVPMTENKMSLRMCGNTDPDDADPLFIYQPRFTKAYISQNNAFPCGSNTVSVTIETNVPLCAKDCKAQITISNLISAVVPDGDLQLQASTDTGHENDRDTFSAAPKGSPGFGRFSGHSLTLFLTCCLECNKEYRFSFVVTNQNCKRILPGDLPPNEYVSIETTNPDSNVAIPKITMNSTVNALPLGGTKQPNHVIQPKFTVKTIQQSSSAPCDKNTITATLATNVPMTAGTWITLSGITSSQTNSTRQLPITSTVRSSVSCLNSTGVWDEDAGTLEVQVAEASRYKVSVKASTAILPSSSKTSDAVFMSFYVSGAWTSEVLFFNGSLTGAGALGAEESASTELTGPPQKLRLRIDGNDDWAFWKIRATFGPSGAVDTVVGTDHPNGKFLNGSSALDNYVIDGDGANSKLEWDLDATQQVWGCAFSFELENPAKALSGVVPQVTSTICTDCSVMQNTMEGKVMVVSPLDFEPVKRPRTCLNKSSLFVLVVIVNQYTSLS